MPRYDHFAFYFFVMLMLVSLPLFSLCRDYKGPWRLGVHLPLGIFCVFIYQINQV